MSTGSATFADRDYYPVDHITFADGPEYDARAASKSLINFFLIEHRLRPSHLDSSVEDKGPGINVLVYGLEENQTFRSELT